MLSSEIQAIWASKSPFVPRKLKIVTIRRTSVLLYPQVNEKMTNPKKTMAYQHNKTALVSADLDQHAHILTLANWLNLILTAESSLANWERKLSRNWANFQYLMILSRHDVKGATITPTTTAGDSSALLPVQDGNVADCCSAGVKFVGVRLKLDFADLTIAAAAHPAKNVIL